MSADVLATIALAVVAGGGALLVRFTKPGFGPAAYAALIDWLARRAAARRYHRHGHRHARPTVVGRTGALARRARTLRLRTPAAPADTVPISMVTTLPDVRSFVRPTC